MPAADCVCTLISRLQVSQIYGPMVGWRDQTPLASSFPLRHYARVRYSGILIPMPLHFAITITRYSPGLHVSSDLCCLAIYISSKCFSIPTEEGLTAPQMDMWTFTFHTIHVFAAFDAFSTVAGVLNTALPARWDINILKNTSQPSLQLHDWPWGNVIFCTISYLKYLLHYIHTLERYYIQEHSLNYFTVFVLTRLSG